MCSLGYQCFKLEAPSSGVFANASVYVYRKFKILRARWRQCHDLCLRTEPISATGTIPKHCGSYTASQRLRVPPCTFQGLLCPGLGQSLMDYHGTWSLWAWQQQSQSNAACTGGAATGTLGSLCRCCVNVCKLKFNGCAIISTGPQLAVCYAGMHQGVRG